MYFQGRKFPYKSSLFRLERSHPVYAGNSLTNLPISDLNAPILCMGPYFFVFSTEHNAILIKSFIDRIAYSPLYLLHISLLF